MLNRSEFGKNIKELRLKKNYTQKEIAVRIGGACLYAGGKSVVTFSTRL